MWNGNFLAVDDNSNFVEIYHFPENESENEPRFLLPEKEEGYTEFLSKPLISLYGSNVVMVKQH